MVAGQKAVAAFYLHSVPVQQHHQRELYVLALPAKSTITHSNSPQVQLTENVQQLFSHKRSQDRKLAHIFSWQPFNITTNPWAVFVLWTKGISVFSRPLQNPALVPIQKVPGQTSPCTCRLSTAPVWQWPGKCMPAAFALSTSVLFLLLNANLEREWAWLYP